MPKMLLSTLIDYPSEFSSPEVLKRHRAQARSLPPSQEKEDYLAYLRDIPQRRKEAEETARRRGITLTKD